MPGRRVPDLTGRAFGWWMVLGRAERPAGARPSERHAYYLCLCVCLNVCTVQGRYLRDGRSSKCTECRQFLSRTGSRDLKEKERTPMEDDLLTALGIESAEDLEREHPEEDDDLDALVHQTARDERPEWFTKERA